MKQEDFQKSLKANEFYPVYVFQSHAFFIEEAWRQLVDHLAVTTKTHTHIKKAPKKLLHAGGLNISRFSAKNIDELDFIEFLETLPIGAQKKAVLLAEIHVAKISFIQTLGRYILRPNPRTYLVIALEQETKIVKPLLEAIKKASFPIVSFPVPKAYELPKWIEDRFKKLGKEVSPWVAHLIANSIGPDFFAIHNEIEKLILYTGDNKIITEKDMEMLLSFRRSYSLFDVMDFIARRNYEEALKKLKELFDSGGEHPLAFLGLFARHIRLLWQAKNGLEASLKADELKNILKLPDFAFNRVLQQSKLLSTRKLRILHRDLYEIDYKLKSSSVPPLYLFESLLLKLMREEPR